MRRALAVATAAADLGALTLTLRVLGNGGCALAPGVVGAAACRGPAWLGTPVAVLLLTLLVLAGLVPLLGGAGDGLLGGAAALQVLIQVATTGLFVLWLPATLLGVAVAVLARAGGTRGPRLPVRRPRGGSLRRRAS